MSWPTDIAAETVTTNSPALLAEEDELFVFGYECKIFRDDEKADWIDKEKHLIPWMGDPNVLIDRYDGRGALMDLRSTDVAVGTQGCANVVEYLEEENAEVEKLCEEERYRDLHEDEEYDESAYQEEEFKRLQQAVNGMGMVPGSESGTHNTHYSAIGYSYDANKGVSMGPEPKKFNEDLPYVQPVGLYIPSDIKLVLCQFILTGIQGSGPATMKSHAIIEKTAKFIAEQGNQMEIILKTKQSTNPQFDFLGYYDTLNPYYKYLVLVIKTGEYKPADVPSEEHDDSIDNDLSGSEEDFDTNYLHPSLVKKEPSIKPTVSSIVYKPTTTNSAYSILVSKIKGATPQEQQKSKSSIEFVQMPKEEIVDDSKSKTSPAGVPSRQPHEMPSSQDQLIIEKMANYVVKNGTAFEGLAKTKGDPRFTFLDPQHAFHWYYLNCKERFKAEHNAIAATGSFLSYSKTDSRRKQNDNKVSSVAGPGHTSTLPLSAAGIPIANYASIQSRPTTVSAELVSRIEEIRKKNTLFSKSKDKLTASTNPVSSACDNAASALTVASATAQRILKRDSKDKPVIKFSSSISQSSTTKDSSTEKDVSCVTGDSKKSKDESSNRISKSFMNDDDEVSSKDVEADSRKKEERRKKAALFLERIKNTEQSAIAAEVMNKEAGEISQSDVESVPSPSHVQLDSEETCKENDPAKSTGSSSLGHLLCSKSENEVQDRLLSSENQDRKNGTIGSSHEKKRKGKRSLSSSSIDSSHTDTHQTSSSSSSSRKRRSKRKHSKKRKKKREREKEKTRSHSKKSKRRKR